MPAIGELAPDFELLNQDGKSVKLSDYRGKKVILFAFPRADTPGCTTQACGFRDSLPKLELDNTVVLGISNDQPGDLLKWKQKEHLSYDLLSDPEHKILESWGVWVEKTNYGKKYMGTARSHWVMGEDGRVIDARINVKPEDSVRLAVAAATGDAG
ncbi:MAG: peroxiredoxin [Anaerolineae bacterium]|nr:peroxiredoxin [Anaerolineae bacterium]MCA9907478.1 peroxiredoxin [Anaerolineae bacterium]